MKAESAKDSSASDKQKLRNEFLKIRDALKPDFVYETSAKIFSAIQNLDIYRKARKVMFYLSSRNEVRTDEMIMSAFQNGKRVFVPTIKSADENIMQAVEISSLKDASKTVFAIRQPDLNKESRIADKNELDLIFAPAIVFDEEGFRIGYGRGFYDRWLAGVDRNKTLAIAYDFQVIPRVPRETFDISVALIATEKRTRRTYK